MAKYQYSATEKKILNRMFWLSGTVFATFTMVKMEGNAFALTMSPAVNELYKEDEEGRKAALKRHDNFFNTHAVMFNFIAGLAYAMEKEKVEKGSVTIDTIENIKVALMGPTAGIGDSFFFNVVRVIAAGIAIGLCSQGNFLGTLIFIALYGGLQGVAKWYLLRVGYTMGTTFIDKVFQSGLMNALTKSAAIVGLTMIGAMVAQMVNVGVAWTIKIGSTSVVVLDTINAVMPGILSIGLVFLLVNLIKKGYRPITLVLGIMVLSVALAFLKIF
jgi:fructoselysine/glucoselysine PTS system EIID component